MKLLLWFFGLAAASLFAASLVMLFFTPADRVLRDPDGSEVRLHQTACSMDKQMAEAGMKNATATLSTTNMDLPKESRGKVFKGCYSEVPANDELGMPAMIVGIWDNGALTFWPAESFK